MAVTDTEKLGLLFWLTKDEYVLLNQKLPSSPPSHLRDAVLTELSLSDIRLLLARYNKTQLFSSLGLESSHPVILTEQELAFVREKLK